MIKTAKVRAEHQSEHRQSGLVEEHVTARLCAPELLRYTATLPMVALRSAGRFGFLGHGQPLLLNVVELGLSGG
jgi:hypothetical protein